MQQMRPVELFAVGDEIAVPCLPSPDNPNTAVLTVQTIDVNRRLVVATWFRGADMFQPKFGICEVKTFEIPFGVEVEDAKPSWAG